MCALKKSKGKKCFSNDYTHRIAPFFVDRINNKELLYLGVVMFLVPLVKLNINNVFISGFGALVSPSPF